MDEQTTANAVLLEKAEDHVVLGLPGGKYQVHLKVKGPVETPVGHKLRGQIALQAWKIDLTGLGGTYIEPLYGWPRRIQGRVKQVHADQRVILMSAAGVPILVHLHETANPALIVEGQMVGVDVKPDAWFEPQGKAATTG